MCVLFFFQSSRLASPTLVEPSAAVKCSPVRNVGRRQFQEWADRARTEREIEFEMSSGMDNSASASLDPKPISSRQHERLSDRLSKQGVAG